MELGKNTCTIWLIAAAVIVLAITYGLLSVGALSVDAGFLSLGMVESPNGLLRPVAAIAVLAGLLVCHVKNHWWEIVDAYRLGYKRSEPIVELVRERVAEVSGTRRYESPHGGIQGSLRRQSFDLGQFLCNDNTLSAHAIIAPDAGTHRRAVVAGIKRLLSRKLWLHLHAPVLLALWALVVIAV